MIAFLNLLSQLKRSMESDLEKIALPLVLKTGETNRFLREDCNIALDRMVENVSSSRVIAIVTSEPITNKNPVIRTTVSRLLAYITDRSEFKNLKRLYKYHISKNWLILLNIVSPSDGDGCWWGEAGRSECGCFKVTVAVRKGVLGGQNNFVNNNWSTIFFQIKKIFKKKTIWG